MAGAPKGQKRISKRLREEYQQADTAARQALLAQHVQYGKESPEALRQAIEAKSGKTESRPRTGAKSKNWTKSARDADCYTGLPLDLVTSIRDAAQDAIDTYQKRERALKARKIAELEAQLSALRAEVD